jgi:DnaK suppressor protein
LTKTAANTPPAAKPAAKAAPKPAASPVAEKAPAKAAPSKAAPAPASAPAAKPAPAATGKTGSKAAAKARAMPETPAQVPSTALSGGGNRFTDRFAPSPPSKLPDPIEVQKNLYKADPKLVNAWKTKPGRNLTEAELQAMPDDEYMNEKQIDFFRARLQQQKDDLLSNAGETTEHLREDTSIVPDPADRATIEEEHALELRTRDRERKLLKKIAQSLARLDTGEYGFCDETGEPIGIARLLARPTATLSLEAQQRRELKQKMFGD